MMNRRGKVNQTGEGPAVDALMKLGKFLLPGLASALAPVGEAVGKKLGSLIHSGKGARLAGNGFMLAGPQSARSTMQRRSSCCNGSGTKLAGGRRTTKKK